ncbi:MAG: cytochrome c3 family protein [Bacteroidota bacterium]|nr:cytochrome c3 family protein [Bacteroidota bacterium]
MLIIVFLIAMTGSAVAQNSPHGPIQQACTDCHTTESWKDLAVPMKFNHATTGFNLNGAHVNVLCLQCHTTKKFSGTPTDCFSCHQNDFTKTLNPNHSLGRFSHECLTCHSNAGWRPSVFQHSKTNFQLTGAHISVDCASCHTNNRFAGLATDCFSCHVKDFTQATLPNHAASQFSHDCLACHTGIAWHPSTFDHNKTRFILVGAHATLECSSCHKNGRFQGIDVDCFSCHQNDFTKTLTPNHLQAQFSHDCLTCHSSMSWKPSTFDHAKTAFKLVGAHQTAECVSCHVNGQFKGLQSDCFSCHQDEFAKTTTPNHTLAQFSHDCTTCHDNVKWKPSTFSHGQTNFPLTGAHMTTDCLFCHQNGQYKGLPTDCFSCHQTDFTKTTNPNHVSGSFDHNCGTCHSTVAWKPAQFDHNKTNFPLTGAHATVVCSSCHASGQFAGTSTDCFACHQKDYTASANPAHATANFPTACISCHSTTAWRPSTFNHTPLFPIGAGDKHSPGRWNTCADCHTNPANFKVFSCITCHEHAKTSMDSKHGGVSGYVYDSNACYRCHPQGRGG